MIEDNIVKKTKEDNIVTLSQAKPHLNVDEDFKDDDSLIQLQIEIATSAAEDYCGKDIALTLNKFDCVDFNENEITFQEAPFREIVSIQKDDGEGIMIDIPESDYSIEEKRTYFTIKFKEQLSTDKFSVSFYTGYDCEDVPKTIVGAVLVKTNDLYDLERTSYTVGANFRSTNAFENLLAAHTINRW